MMLLIYSWKSINLLVKYIKKALFLSLLLFNAGCGDGPLNNPYPNVNGEDNTLYTSFSERPKHLDPAKSYSSNEWIITNQVYEPPLQYHYLKRPYELEPLVAQRMPEVTYYDKNMKEISGDNVNEISFSKYLISIKPNIQFQMHPAFAIDANSKQYLYHDLSEEEAEKYDELSDFTEFSTRELTAADFIYQIKRLADPSLNSPVFGLMKEYIVGLDELRENIVKTVKRQNQELAKNEFIDLRQFDLEGVKQLNDYQYEITIKGHYPQLQYWLAMPFFAPMPWEAVKFYSQDALIEHNITLDWYPIGTGPYILKENNPNLQILLEKNPTFHGESYPDVASLNNVDPVFLSKQGKALPFLHQVKFILEKESIPYWNKFLQGYYDQSGISSDSFDQAVQVNSIGNVNLTKSLQDKGITLKTSVLPSTFYWGFNMLDEVVGGLGEKQKKLRQAISIAFDMEEFINIFQNGRGQVAQSLIPPGIFGFIEGDFNKTVFEKNEDGFQRRPIEQAKTLLTEAGYPNGIDPKTNKPLVLYLDAISGGGPDTHALYAWVRKQFKKLEIELVVRDTQYNRFQDKMRSGDAQIFSWGWNADYPDPENFLFLLYGPNSKVKYDGENAANYDNPKFNEMFSKMKSMENTPERLALIKEMLALIQQDAPWIWGYHPKLYSLTHQWMGPFKPNAMSRNTIKYLSIDANKRGKLRNLWNQPTLWPIWLFSAIFILLVVPALLQYRKKTHKKLTLSQTMRDDK